MYTYSVHFKSKKELKYNKFVDPNVRGAKRRVYSDLQIYLILFFLFDIITFDFSIIKKIRSCPTVSLMLEQRRRRWPNIKATVAPCRELAGAQLFQ